MEARLVLSDVEHVLSFWGLGLGSALFKYFVLNTYVAVGLLLADANLYFKPLNVFVFGRCQSLLSALNVFFFGRCQSLLSAFECFFFVRFQSLLSAFECACAQESAGENSVSNAS